MRCDLGGTRLAVVHLGRKQFLIVLATCALLATHLLAWPLHAATTQYSYDAMGRLIQAARSDGSVVQYQYDDNGNVVAINRLSVATLSIAGLTPLIGHVGATVTVSGTGFSAVLADNTVKFGAIVATVNTATGTQLVVTVPQGASTGPISVTVGATTATSAASYVVRRPTIATFAPTAVNPAQQVTVQVRISISFLAPLRSKSETPR